MNGIEMRTVPEFSRICSATRIYKCWWCVGTHTFVFGLCFNYWKWQ